MTKPQTQAKPDFSGWATKNDLKCKDGRVIKRDAFAKNDKKRVPLVWQHGGNKPENILGHVLLENREDGVYAYGFFNSSPNGTIMKEAVSHGDLNALSIWANELSEIGLNVVHGDIKEVSLCIAGQNPGAMIDNVYVQHGDFDEPILDSEKAIITFGLELVHSDSTEFEHAESDKNGKTRAEVWETLNEDQQEFFHEMLGEALRHSDDSEESDDDTNADDSQDSDDSDNSDDDTNSDDDSGDDDSDEGSEDSDDEDGDSDDSDDSDSENDNNGDDVADQDQEGSDSMTHNVFEGENNGSIRHKLTLEQLKNIVNDGITRGSAKESFIAHAAEYGIESIDLLFPDFKATSTTPELLARQADWVTKVLDGVKKSPFARIKSIVADLTALEARAKGYATGEEKKDEVISLLRRTTTPRTIYKKQKLDRDDIIDITEIDVIAWLKWEMRFMLNEEIARAILIGDGRAADHEDKIKDPAGATSGEGIRSILLDHAMYAPKTLLAANVTENEAVKAIVRARSKYRGTGSPTAYMSDSALTEFLLIEDKIGRRLYETEAALAAALRVKEIVPVEVMEEHPDIIAIIVNLTDYTLGANKGGEISFFDDFDIDFNQNKYLIETRPSGALTKPKSALVISREVGTAVTPTQPSFNGGTDTITIPTVTGVSYTIDGEVVTGSVVIEGPTEVVALAQDGYYIPSGTTDTWSYTP